VTRIYILTEGQTEEAFVTELLTPHYSLRGLYLKPIIVTTSPGHRGGVVSYAKVRPQIERLCKQDSGAYITTMFDLYALPKDFPGKEKADYRRLASGRAKAGFLENELQADVDCDNFIPNLIVHEFEALLFSRVSAFEQWTDDDDVWTPLKSLREASHPEDINDGIETAPSKRILAVMPQYQKTVHGPLIACDIGLDTIRGECPHFHQWLEKLEQLA